MLIQFSSIIQLSFQEGVMYLDIKELFKFYFDTSLGKRTTLSLQQTLTDLFDCGKSEVLLGYGFSIPLLLPYLHGRIKVLSLMPSLQGSVSWPESNGNINLLVDESFWPTETESVDSILLLHGLEMSLNPHKLMSEVWRVLKPNGTLIIFVANRAGFWARSDVTPFGYGRPYSYNQIDNLLDQTNFKVEKSILTMDGLPSLNNLSFSIPNITTYLLKKAKVRLFSGVICIRASKTLYAGEKLRRESFSFVVGRRPKPSSVINRT